MRDRGSPRTVHACLQPDGEPRPRDLPLSKSSRHEHRSPDDRNGLIPTALGRLRAAGLPARRFAAASVPLGQPRRLDQHRRDPPRAGCAAISASAILPAEIDPLSGQPCRRRRRRALPDSFARSRRPVSCAPSPCFASRERHTLYALGAGGQVVPSRPAGSFPGGGTIACSRARSAMGEPRGGGPSRRRPWMSRVVPSRPAQNAA